MNYVLLARPAFAPCFYSKADSNFDLTLYATDVNWRWGIAEARTLLRKVALAENSDEPDLAMAELNIF